MAPNMPREFQVTGPAKPGSHLHKQRSKPGHKGLYWKESVHLGSHPASNNFIFVSYLHLYLNRNPVNEVKLNW